MLTKTKIALAAVLVAASASVALADGEFDGNLANRYPAYNGPAAQYHQNFTSSNVSLGNRGIANQGIVSEGRPQVHTFHYDSAPVISGGGY
jgi:hypothetical protein